MYRSGRSVGKRTRSLGGEFSRLKCCTSEVWKDHSVTVRLGKWMKEQNVITAGHCWEQCDCLEGQVSLLKIGFF